MLVLYKDGYLLQKQKDPFTSFPKIDGATYIVHTRAPTSKTTSFAAETSHPFIAENIVSFHNGIISNTQQLKTNWPDNSNPVDSSYIPLILNTYRKGRCNLTVNRFSIKDCLERLEGIYGVVIADTTISDNVYVARCASTIYWSEKDRALSSAKIPNSVLLDEGVIYQFTTGDIQSLSPAIEFKFNSPYYVPPTKETT